jgi:glycine/D-amino acid oxidase-like deaminating enzyme
MTIPSSAGKPGAGYADAYMTLSAYVRAARRRGAIVREGSLSRGSFATACASPGVETAEGTIAAGVVISAQNMWSRELAQWIGVDVPLTLSRHAVVSLEGETPYTPKSAVVIDWVPEGGIYFRSYSGRQLMIGDTTDGEPLSAPDTRQGDVSLDYVAHLGEMVGQSRARLRRGGPRALVDRRLRRHARLESGARSRARHRRPACGVWILRPRVQAFSDRGSPLSRNRRWGSPTDLPLAPLLDRALRDRPIARGRLRPSVVS